MKIQRRFLWGDVKRGYKVVWVKWDVVCKLKKFGGLDVRDLRLVNMALLDMSRWSLLSGASGIWHDTLITKYGYMHI